MSAVIKVLTNKWDIPQTWLMCVVLDKHGFILGFFGREV